MEIVNEDPKTYWDFSEKERAEMTREQVEALLDVELMTKGVLKVVPPKLEEQIPCPTLEDFTWYQVGDLVFPTIENAKAFMGLNPHKQTYEYLGGSWDNRLTYSIDFDAKKVEVVILKSHEDVLTHKAILEKTRGIQSRNEKAMAEYEKQAVRQEKVFAGVWEDWGKQRGKVETFKRVFDTFDNYLGLSGGNEVTAARFLFKSIPPKDVFDAYEFMGRSLPAGIQTVKDETDEATKTNDAVPNVAASDALQAAEMTATSVSTDEPFPS